MSNRHRGLPPVGSKKVPDHGNTRQIVSTQAPRGLLLRNAAGAAGCVSPKRWTRPHSQETRLTTMPAWISDLEMPRRTPTTEPTPPRYEDALAELERLVQRMEDGQLPLDQLLDSYRRGAELLELCRSRLAAVEEQVKVLEDGQLKPWVMGT